MSSPQTIPEQPKGAYIAIAAVISPIFTCCTGNERNITVSDVAPGGALTVSPSTGSIDIPISEALAEGPEKNSP